MLDLPELLDNVLRRLGRHDLSQCAQVNKQWHALTIPYLWRDLICIHSDNTRGKAFSRIVLEDYLQEKGSEEGPQQSSALSKYGPLIRLLPNPRDLVNALQAQVYTQQGNEPTAHELLFHLFKHSSKAQVISLGYEFKDPESDEMKSILAFTLPRLRSLYIQGSLQGTRSEFFKFKSVLGLCSTTLRFLDVGMSVLRANEAADMEDKATEDELDCWTSLEELTLRHNHDTWDAGQFWSWIWKRCGHVNHLRVRKIGKSTPSLLQAMLAHMPNLQKITVGDYSILRDMPYLDAEMGDMPYLNAEMSDDVVAALFSGSRHGWKSVSIWGTVNFGQESMNTLAMHYSTLEEFYIDGHCGLPSSDLVQVLKSCPHLHTLSYADSCYDCYTVHGSTFVDLDPDTGLLKPWLCEGSLKSLTVKIHGIPRPNSEEESTLNVEEYPGQGREMQSQVCDRLGRLTSLESLRLHDECGALQSDCLEMSLESGLDKLSGLKSMKELCVGRMATKIGIKEVQWMAENWPKFSVIRGLDEDRDVEAAINAMQLETIALSSIETTLD
ncbi:MAG: hypothetical protein J3Q66DRAFT_443345 [Benniella sp.]|nr:MAG: hypothetical protein J3Q66DRAFT_443345 [Benniella sp.]